MKIILVSLMIVAALDFPAHGAGRKKEQDRDVIYDENQVPAYELPELLVSAEGQAITTPDEWMNVRRPQILALFANLVYGQIPSPASPIQTEYVVQKVDEKFMDGKATRKEVLIRFRNGQGKAKMLVLVFVPNAAPKPVPAFMMISFDDNRSDKLNANPDQSGPLRNG